MPKEYKFGPISFRLDPDAIKEEALNMVPWPVGTIAREMYSNPDGSAIETVKQVGRETPFLGSLLSGEYSDAAKEAILLGFPVKAKTKAEIKKLGPDTQFAINDYRDARYYNPKTKAVGEIGEDGLTSYNPATFNTANITSYPTIDMKEMIKTIDNSNALHKLNRTGKSGKHPLSFSRELDNRFNPYDLDNLNNPNLTNTVELQTLKEGNDLYSRYAGYRGRGDHSSLEGRIRRRDVVNKATPLLKKGESLTIDEYGNLYIHKGKNYYSFDINSNGTRIIDKDKDNLWGKDSKPYSDPNLDLDLKQFRNDVEIYNANRMFEDNYINFDPNNPRKWADDNYKAKEDYWNAINGPYFEDIMGYER